MKVESLIFNIIAVFCVAAAVVYGVWSREPIGTTALALSGGLTGLIGGFFWFVSRRIDARPEDRKDADIAEGAGELGFFPPASYWPFALALSAALMGLALAFWYSWLILIALAALLITIGGLLFEFYVGQNATQS
ncbi:cytochrome c oxidase subunit 4 [Blastococcus haudaquaticus]|uniref:Cytochrome c oxidase polypeptide 4 n=1 Tax=Blastococcus haudaquaticus TaxID=1938745 RepID=A0A286H597_9ACTN|nr:cytochrome c oxidase subunit 4 [Blastococcus haudaquaticus]SOE02862.1 Cytochrome c oxidase subunit IV [Blastococcus haudaquaticus]